jgi:6-phosphogluconolactonase
MDKQHITSIIKAYDERRDIAIPGDNQETLSFCVDHFIASANESIDDDGFFSVALSGGSTPKAIFEGLALEKNRSEVDWSRVLVFWSDERCVPPEDPSSNYRMAMESGFVHLPIPLENVHRMKAENDPEEYAKNYEKIIEEKLSSKPFDLIMLGMGGDGHTASLFPKTHGLNAPGRKVIANYIPQMETWRMTMTYDCINEAKRIAIYVLGKGKASTVKEVFQSEYNPNLYPIQKIGTPTNKALWILDDASAELIR